MLASFFYNTACRPTSPVFSCSLHFITLFIKHFLQLLPAYSHRGGKSCPIFIAWYVKRTHARKDFREIFDSLVPPVVSDSKAQPLNLKITRIHQGFPSIIVISHTSHACLYQYNDLMDWQQVSYQSINYVLLILRSLFSIFLISCQI